jgi:basic amino acid/polyamine antiporter, APA family
LGQPRILMAMSRDGLLPPVFSRVHPRFRTPAFATLMTGIFVAVGAALASLEEMADLCSIGTLSAFLLVCVGIPVLRRRDPHRVRPFRTPWVPVVPVLGVVACLWLLGGLPGLAWWRFAVWLAVGVAVYFLYGHRRSRLAAKVPH